MKNETIKTRAVILALILTSLSAYLEWGRDNHLFLLQGEFIVLSKLLSEPESLLHPFIILPLFGQLLLIINLFRKEPGNKMTYSGIIAIAVLVVMILFVGILRLNFRMIISVLPFIITSIIAFLRSRPRKPGGGAAAN